MRLLLRLDGSFELHYTQFFFHGVSLWAQRPYSSALHRTRSRASLLSHRNRHSLQDLQLAEDTFSSQSQHHSRYTFHGETVGGAHPLFVSGLDGLHFED